jgi:Na+/H+-translocating membrane pyrophosphatase
MVEKVLTWQLIISAIILTGLIYLATTLALSISSGPGSNIYLGCVDPNSDIDCYELSPFNAWLCAFSGLIAGLFIGLLTDYYTSNAHGPTIEVANACKTGAATNIIYGLALGYLSVVAPVILLSLSAYISHKTLGMLGLALAALGMLSNLSIGLAIDAYGPISDNAGGIAEMAELDHNFRECTDALDAAGNTTAAIGKGFAIGSAALVSMSLYGAFITRASAPPNSTSNNPILV